ncbi:MAG: hypothetical protein RhofKO_25570 [Rhodothermales bacterium]
MSNKLQLVGVRVSPETKRRLRLEAARQDKDMSAYAREAIEQRLDHDVRTAKTEEVEA